MRTYLKQVIGAGYNPALVDAFIEQGPSAALAGATHRTAHLRPLSPDYYPTPPAPPSSAARWKWSNTTASGWARFKDLQMPPPGMLLFGGMMVNRVDIQHFLSMRRSPKSCGTA
jgi:hypothetical protein